MERTGLSDKLINLNLTYACLGFIIKVKRVQEYDH